jgi:hypothetical protein
MPVLLSATVYVCPKDRTFTTGMMLITQSLCIILIQFSSKAEAVIIRFVNKGSNKDDLQSEKQSHKPLDHFPCSDLSGIC